MMDKENMRDMRKGSYLFSSESVTEGHPDKVADQISDAVLDEALSQDPEEARVACETLISHGLVVVAGEITTTTRLDIPEIVRRTISEIGYKDSASGFDPENCCIVCDIRKQTHEIAGAVGQPDRELGAGDQGHMFGYATNETPELMPLPIMLAHRLVMKSAELRRSRQIPWLLPDGKSQVTVRYEGHRPVAVEKVVLSLQYTESVDETEVRDTVIREIIEQIIPPDLRSPGIEYHVNPSGKFTIGGPAADTGLTGRKIIVDTYGGSCPHGGGCFSGKDPTKIDRSASYAARYIAKNIVAAGLAERCTVQLSYAIGMAEPLSVMIDNDGTGQVDEHELEKAVREIFPLIPGKIIDALELRRPIYKKTAVYGHFGRELPEFTWERCDRVEALMSYFGLK